MPWNDAEDELAYVQEALRHARELEQQAQRNIAYYSQREQGLLDKIAKRP